MVDETTTPSSRIADPGAAALVAFGMALICVFVVEIFAPASRGVIAYGLLYGGLMEAILSILVFIRGDAYLGTLLAVFGTWLLTYFLFGMNTNPKINTLEARGAYALILEVAVVLLAIPAIRDRIIPIILAFIFLGLVVFFLGMGLLTGHEWMNKALGWSALLAAMPILYLAYERLVAAVPPRR